MSVRLDTSGLDKLRQMAADLGSSEAQVGIFADKDARSDGKSNATIGGEHEFGLVSEGSKMPERSWLRMPLHERLAKNISASSLRATMMTDPTAENLLNKLGADAERTVQQSFDTGGFGEWPSLHPQTVEAKGHDTILIDSGELRAAVSHRVVGQPYG